MTDLEPECAGLRRLILVICCWTISGCEWMSTPKVPTAHPWPGPNRLELTPAWTWLHRDAPRRSYSYAQFLDDRIVGPWFCLDRETGREIWRSVETLPDDIFRIRDGMIVATEALSYGPTTGSYGVYGIELETGRVAWINHGESQHEQFPTRVELVEGEQGWDRDGPSRVTDEGVVTEQGRLLDLQTGKTLRRLGKDEPREDTMDAIGLTDSLQGAGALDLPGLGRLFLGTGAALEEVRQHLAEPVLPGFHFVPTNMGRDRPFGFTFESLTGKILWQFDLSMDRYWTDGGYQEFGRFLILIYAEPTISPREWDERTNDGEPLTAPFSAAVLDLATGEITSTLKLGDEPANMAQIETLDEHGLLLSADFGPDRLYVYVAF